MKEDDVGIDDFEAEWVPPPESQIGYVPLYKYNPGKTHSLIVCSTLPTSKLTHYYKGRTRVCGKSSGESCLVCENKLSSTRWTTYFIGIDHTRNCRGRKPFYLYWLTSTAYNKLPEWAKDRKTAWKGRTLNIRRAGASDKSALLAEFPPGDFQKVELGADYSQICSASFLRFCLSRIIVAGNDLISGSDG